MEFEEGKVYLQNIHTGSIHLYERYMAHNKNYATIIPNPVKEPAKEPEQTGTTQPPELA